MDQIYLLSNFLKINPVDITKNILKSNKYYYLVRGDYKSFNCNYYYGRKIEYFNSIKESIILDIIKNKVPVEHSKKFNFNEIEIFSMKYKINIKDFLVFILGIKKYERKPISKVNIFQSEYYKNNKEKYLLENKNNILNKIMIKRVNETSSYSFNRKEIINLSQYYNINKRDFIVFILGKSDQLYYDFKSQRVESINSLDYFEIKKEYIKRKKEEVKEMFNPDKRTYFNLKDIQELSNLLGINTDDIILHFFDKTKKNLYNLKTNYRNRNRISYGQYRSGKIPNSYIENNFELLKKDIVEVSVKSVFNFLNIRYDETNNIFDDLTQEGLIYLMEHGNPLENKIYMIGDNDIEYKKEHGKIFYKKSFYFILTEIKKYINLKEKNGKIFEINLKTNRTVNNSNENNVKETINEISNESITNIIITYFSENTFS